MKKSIKNILFVICPQRDFYDVLAIGNKRLLKKLSNAESYSHLILKSQFGGLPILILDSYSKLSDAQSCIILYKKLYEKKRRLAPMNTIKKWIK